MPDLLRRPGRLLAALVLAVLCVLPGGGAARAADTGKYYVVPESAGAQRPFLYQIAAATLGDGNRYAEIVELNRDRVQPDGDRLTDPLVLRPGWYLALPADASGTGVRTGPIPVFTPAPVASAAPVGQVGGGAYDPVKFIGGIAVAFVLLLGAVMILRGGKQGRSRAPDRVTGRSAAIAPAPAAIPPASDEPPPVVTAITASRTDDTTVMISPVPRPRPVPPPPGLIPSAGAAPQERGDRAAVHPAPRRVPAPEGAPAPVRRTGPPTRLPAAHWPLTQKPHRASATPAPDSVPVPERESSLVPQETTQPVVPPPVDVPPDGPPPAAPRQVVPVTPSLPPRPPSPPTHRPPPAPPSRAPAGPR